MSWNTRRFIIGTLEHRGPCTVAELAELSTLTDGTIRRHLREMRAAGSVVEARPVGRPMRFALAPKPTAAAPAPAGMDPIGWFIATSHQLLGHDKTAALIGVAPRGECLLCEYERNPSDGLRQTVIETIGRPSADPESGMA
jgi:DNA-binding transcriptional ArsR family regulator